MITMFRTAAFGHSLMMQMLDAAGCPFSPTANVSLTRQPKGYLEWERIKQLPKDPNLIAEVEGKL